MTFRFRKKGLPKRLKRILGGVPGLVAACNVHVGGDEWPAAKVVVFKDRKSMRNFHRHILPRYSGAEEIGPPKSLGTRCAGFVHKLLVGCYDEKAKRFVHDVADRRYFCVVGLVEGDLTAEIIAHEAVHVGFAWDYRTQGKSHLADPRNDEENVCYAAGIFLDQCLSFIKREGLRET